MLYAILSFLSMDSMQNKSRLQQYFGITVRKSRILWARASRDLCVQFLQLRGDAISEEIERQEVQI